MGKLLPSYNKFIFETIKNSISSNTNILYAFASKNIPFENNIPEDVFLSVKKSKANPQYQLEFGKRLTSNDFSAIIKKITWTSGTVYTRYDDEDIDLLTKNFFVMTLPETEGGYRHIFKCLKNGNNSASLNKPDIIQTTPFDKADGYRWKYLYSISQLEYDKFASDLYIPIIANNDITNTALETSGIDDIVVDQSGTNYITFHNGKIKSITNTTCFQIESSASSDNDFYTKSSIYMYTPTIQSGQLKEITRYVSNSSGKWIFTTTPANTSLITEGLTEYKISPTVRILGDGLSNAYAYSVITNNSISEIKIIDRGSGYTHATTQIIANTSYGSNSSIRAIIPPLGGHGSNLDDELNSPGFVINFKFANSENNVIPTLGSYSTIGLLRNPKQSANITQTFISNSFSQILKANVSPPTTFTIGEKIIGQSSLAEGLVFHSNSSVIWMTGDKNFSNNELIVGVTSNNSCNISINTKGDIYNKNIDIIYLHNIPKVERTTTQTETFKFMIGV